VLRDLGRALFAPQRFFEELLRRPESRGRAYAALLLPQLLAGATMLLGWQNQIAQLPPALAAGFARLGPIPFVVGSLGGAMLTALLLWFVAWLPLRLGVGRRPRLGEAAAWTQLPKSISVLLAMVAFLSPSAPQALTLGASLVSEAWCGWLVYRALAVVARDAIWRGLGAYALMEIPRLALLLQDEGPAASSGLTF
jgi:hypothetical protein